MAFAGKYLYMAHNFILLRLNPFNLKVNRKVWWFEHSCVIFGSFLVSSEW